MSPLRSLPLALTLLALLAAGCFWTRIHTVTSPVGQQAAGPYAAPLLGVVAADSLDAGEPLTVKVTVEYGGCVVFYGYDLLAHGDSIFVTPLLLDMSQPGRPCPDIFWRAEKDCVVTPPSSGRLTLVVNGDTPPGKPRARLVLPVTVGHAAASVRRYDWQVLDAGTLQPIANARLKLIRGGNDGSPPDTMATLVTGTDGRAGFTDSCAGADTAYAVSAECAGYGASWFHWSAARCGVPERGQLLLRRNASLTGSRPGAGTGGGGHAECAAPKSP